MKRLAWTVLSASLFLQACASTEDQRGRLAVAGGTSRLQLESDGVSATADGTQQSLRMEVVQPLDYVDNVEVGLRLKGGARQIHETIGVSAYEFESNQLALMPTFRALAPMSGSTRLYGEFSIGYEHFWGEERLLGVTTKGDDGGLAYGAGAGVEFVSAAQSALGVGFEWSRLDVSEGDTDGSFDDLSLVVSWSFGF